MPFIPDIQQTGAIKPTTSGFIPDEQPIKEEPKLFGSKAVSDLSEGFGQGVLSTVTNIGKLTGSSVNWAMGKGFTPSAPGGLQYSPFGEKLATAGEQRPTTTAGKIGFGTEQLAEFLIPSPIKVAAVAKNAPLAVKAVNLIAKSISQALDFGTRTAIQTQGDPAQTATSAALGVAFPVAGAVLKKALPIIGDITSSILGSMIGKDKEVIKIAFQNPIEVAQKITGGVIPLQVREKAVTALKEFETAVKDTFAKGLQTLQEKTPVRFILGKYNSTKQIMQNELLNSMNGMPKTFRDFKVSVQNKGTSLNFDKMNSSIIKPSERNNVKMAWQTVLNQKDFSPSGVEATASRLYKLMDYGEVKTETSALVSDIYNRYLKSIKTVYPELAKLRTQYATQMKIISGINEVIRSTKNEVANPIAVTGAVKKLSNLFQEDGEAYLYAIQQLEKKTGINLLKDLAASEFLHIAPASFGSRMAQAGLLAGGVAYNPWILAVLPLFSPKVVGKLVTTAGRVAPTVEAVYPYSAPAVTSGVQQVQRNLNFNQ